MTIATASAVQDDAFHGDAQPRVLVLMATYNGARWVENQVRSILSQEGVDVTLIVRDDSSVDGTVDVVRSVDGCGRIEVLRSPRSSGSAAQNFFHLLQTADASKHHFVALADQDDIWQPTKLRCAVELLSSTGAAGYSAAVRAFWPDGRSVILHQVSRQRTADYLFEGAGQGCTFVLTSKLFAEVQQALQHQAAELERIHYHDWTVYALCRVFGRHWIFDPKVCMDYRQHASNDTGARWGRSALKRRLALIRSGWYGEQINAIAQLCVTAGRSTTSAAPAIAYLQLATSAGRSLRGRLPLCYFVLRSGRRRTYDRLILALAALGGYLNRVTERT